MKTEYVSFARIRSAGDDSWYLAALCQDSELDYSWDRPATDAHRALCLGCPVLEPCRTTGLEQPWLPGVWGGLDQGERYGPYTKLRQCDQCGLRKPVQKFRQNHQYPSTCLACAETDLRKLCVQCGVRFTPRPGTTQTICSEPCRRKRYLSKQAEHKARKRLGLPLRTYQRVS